MQCVAAFINFFFCLRREGGVRVGDAFLTFGGGGPSACRGRANACPCCWGAGARASVQCIDPALSLFQPPAVGHTLGATVPAAWANLGANAQQELLNVAQSVYFVTVVMCQLGNLVALQSRKIPFGAMVNGRRHWPAITRWTVGACAAEILVVVIVLYVPGCNAVFLTAPVPATYWFVGLAFSVAIFFVGEARKWLCHLYPDGVVARVSW